MPAVTLARPTAVDGSELGRICYEAFKDIAARHGFESDFTSPQFATMITNANIQSETTYSVCARVDGDLAGSNFLVHHDHVGGVGPVSVDPTRQGLGVGRRLMNEMLEYAREAGIERVRLVQDAYNVTSMCLYSSLGFDTKHPVGLLELKASARPSGDIRTMTEADVDAADALCREIYGVSRRNDIPAATRLGGRSLVIERGGRIRGYLAPWMIGHAVAETEGDMLALMGEAARYAPGGPIPMRMLCPLTEGNLFRGALAAGHRLKKIMNLMALGPYEEPQGVWLPSVAY